MFPWICLKCGTQLEDEESLVSHIKGFGHQLTPEQLQQFEAAMRSVAAKL